MTNEEFIESVRLPNEEWRDVVGYEGIYMVSSLGRVASLRSPYKNRNRIFHKKQKILKPSLRRKGYLAVTLSKEETPCPYLVHRLVAFAFIENKENLPFINHKDENPQNNRADNLEWCTNKYNCNYGGRNKRMGETIHNTSVCRKKVVQLTTDMKYVCEYVSLVEASMITKTQRSCISQCCLGKNKTGGGYKWMYLSDYKSLVKQNVNELSPNG